MVLCKVYNKNMNAELEQFRVIVKEELKEELKTFNNEVFLPSFGKYTEEVVLPAIETANEELKSEIKETKDELNGRIGKLQSDTIDFVTRQINDAKGEIIRAVREERERDRVFKRTVVEILERHHLASAEEVDILRGLLNRPV